MKHRISVGVIAEEEERLLLVHHVKAGVYDFWVAPGGGVQGGESLQEGAQREAREETGLEIEALKLAYIEELIDAETRHCKFWFNGQVNGGVLSVKNPGARAEYITEAAWLSKGQLEGKIVFPPVIVDRYWQDRAAGFTVPVQIELRRIKK